MKKFLNHVLGAMLVLLAFATNSQAQANLYAFAQSTGTYTPITGGTVHATGAALDDETYLVTLPFTFTFNGTAYTQVYVSMNGYVSFGATNPGTGTRSAISSTTANIQVAAAWSRDLQGTATAELRSETIGTAPNQTFVAQWTDVQNFSGSGQLYDFQVRINQANDVAGSQTVEFVYGSWVYTNASSTTGQVGLRGLTNADYNNRTTTTNWSATTAGTSNTASVTASTTVQPASGLTFTYTPPVACSGTPAAGNVVNSSNAASANYCTGGTVGTLTLANSQSGVTGLTYQWQNSNDNVTYTDIAAATAKTYAAPTFSGTITYYRVKVSCGTDFAFSVPFVANPPAAPATQASNVTYVMNGALTGATIGWTNGNGTGRAVFINTTNSFVDPVAPNSPGTANTVYSGTGQQLVYASTGSSVTVTGLTCGGTYYVRVYEYQLCTTSYYYQTATGTNNPSAALVFPVSASPYSQDFGTVTTLPTNWGNYITTSSWFISSTFGLTGSGAYKSVSSTATNGELRTNKIGPVLAGDRIAFSTRATAGTATTSAAAAGWGSLILQISSNCGSTWTDVATYTDINSLVWSLKTFDLSSYVGQDIIVKFKTTYGTSSYTVAVDNFSVAPPPPTDLSAIQLLTPPAAGCVGSNAETVTVQVKNTGTAALDFSANPFTITTNVTGAAIATLTATVNTGTLAVDATMNVPMSATLDMTVAGTYTFNATVALTGDGNATNNAIPASSRTVLVGANTPYLQDFTTSPFTAAGGWANLPNANNATNTWTVGANHGIVGNGVYYNFWNSAGTGFPNGATSARFRTMKVNNVGAEDRLSFVVRCLDWSTSYPTNVWNGTGELEVAISTDCGATYTAIQTYATAQIAGPGWNNKIIPLAAYIGQNILVRFTGKWITGDFFMDIDNVQIAPPPATDLSTISLTTPSGCFGSATETVTIRVKNTGTSSIDFATNPVTITTNVTGAATATLTADVTSGNLGVNAELDVPMSTTLDMTAIGNYTFNSTGNMTGDGDAFNNSMSPTIRTTLLGTTSPEEEDFSAGTTLPAGWAMDQNWFVDAAHGRTNNGLYKTVSLSNNNGECRTLKIGPLLANDELKFDTRVLNSSGVPPTNWGNLLVEISTDCGNTYTNIGTYDDIASTDWLTKTISLNSYVGQTVVVRFKTTYVSTSGTWTVSIDNFAIKAPPALDMGMTGLVSPAASGCYGSSEDVTVNIKNFGTANIDFAVNPTTLTVNVTGAATQTFTVNLTSGTLASGATMPVDMGTIDMSAPGVYTFSGNTTVVGDGGAGNDAMGNNNRTTLASALAPHEEFFVTAPANWTTVSWFQNASNGNPDGRATINIYSSVTTGWLNSIKMDNIPAGSSLNFDTRCLNWSGYPNGGAPAPGWGELKVGISTDCGGTYTDLATYNDIEGATWLEKNIDLSAYAGMNIIVRFTANWFSASGSDVYVDVDNVLVGVVGNYYPDVDDDDYGDANGTSIRRVIAPATGYASNNTDCNDAEVTINPGATEECGNSIDENCDTYAGISAFDVDLVKVTTACTKFNATISNVTDAGGTVLYSKDGGTTWVATPSFLNLVPSSYTFAVKDVTNCVLTQTEVVNAPMTLNVTGDDLLCFGDTDGEINVEINDGFPGYSIEWKKGTTVVGTTAMVSNLGFGTYKAYVTDSKGCIKISGNAVITQPAKINIVLTAANESCFDANDGGVSNNTTGGVGGFSYAWTSSADAGFSSTNQHLTNVGGPATYTVVAADGNGCSATKGALVKGATAPLTITSLTTKPVACLGGSNGSATAKISGGNAGLKTFTWTPGGASGISGASHTASNLAAGNYTVAVSDVNGCSTTGSVTVMQPTAALNLPAPTITPTGSTYKVVFAATGGFTPYKYRRSLDYPTNSLWSAPNIGTFTLVPAGTHTFQVNDGGGSFSATVPKGCIVGADYPVPATFKPATSEVRGESSNDFALVPNPAKGSVFVDFNGVAPTAGDLEIRDVKGALIQQINVSALTNTGSRISLDGLNSGVFFVTLRQDGVAPTTKRLVVMN